jgi:glutathione S-transferase
MKLIGQYDSPFVRRVAVAMQIYGLDYEHLPWSTFGDADKVARYNPLRRVPVLVLDTDEALIESGAILDYLDGLVGPARALIASSGPDRHRTLRTISLATGLADKAVTLVYSRLFHGDQSPDFVARCQTQIADALAELEASAEARTQPWWFGTTPGHADIGVTCVLRFLRAAHPALFDEANHPALVAHCQKAEALPSFSAVVQEFIPPD